MCRFNTGCPHNIAFTVFGLYTSLFLKQIAEEIFVKAESSGDIGTSVASMNRTGKTTAKKGPYDQYNAFKEFFDRETEAHIITAWMAFVGLDKMDGKMKI